MKTKIWILIFCMPIGAFANEWFVKSISENSNKTLMGNFFKKPNVNVGFSMGIMPGSFAIHRYKQLLKNKSENLILSSGLRLGYNAISSKTVFKGEYNFELTEAGSPIFMLNWGIQLHYKFSKRWGMEINSDIIGLGYGRKMYKNMLNEDAYITTKGKNFNLLGIQGQHKSQLLLTRRFLKKFECNFGAELSASNRVSAIAHMLSRINFKTVRAGLVFGLRYRFSSSSH